ERDRHVGSRLRTRRVALKMSQGKLGAAIGVSYQQIQKFETGINRVGAGRLEAMAHALDVPVSFFFDDATRAPTTEHVAEFFASSEGVLLATAYLGISSDRL